MNDVKRGSPTKEAARSRSVKDTLPGRSGKGVLETGETSAPIMKV